MRRTGEIGMISILGYERYKGGTRVEFVCGGRALKTLRADHALLAQLGQLYSAAPSELPKLTEKLFQERSTLVRENSRLNDQVLEMEAEQLVQGGVRAAGAIFVRASFSGRSLEDVKIVARKITKHPDTVALLGLLQNEKASVVLSRSPGVDGSCGVAVKETAAKLGGKGGGSPDLAQAGGIAPEALERWLDELQSYFGRDRGQP